MNRKGTRSQGIHKCKNKIPKGKKYINPVVEKCQICNKRKVRRHHYLCDQCWVKKQNGNKTEIPGKSNEHKEKL